MSLEFLAGLPEFRALVARLKKGEDCLFLTGLIPEARPYFYALLSREVDRPIVVILPGSISPADIRQETENFFQLLSVKREIQILPALGNEPYLEVAAPLEAVASRMKTFYSLLLGHRPLVFTSLAGLLKPVPTSEDLRKSFIRINSGEELDRDWLLERLKEFGYAHEDLVASAGEYAYRGGIVDVYSVWSDYPVRLEFAGNLVSSIREFDASTQRSVNRIESAVIPSLREFPGEDEFVEKFCRQARKRAPRSRDLEKKIELLRQGEFFPSFAYSALLVGEHFAPITGLLENPLYVFEERELVEKDWEERLAEWRKAYAEQATQSGFFLPPEEIFLPEILESVRKRALNLSELGGEEGGDGVHFSFQTVPRFDNRIPFFLQYLKKRQEERDLCYLFISNPGKRERLAAVLREEDIPARLLSDPREGPRGEEVNLVEGELRRGFCFPRQKIFFFAERDIFTEEKVITSRVPRKLFFSQFQDLNQGDYVVHTEYGVGRFNGLKKLDFDGRAHDFIEIIYRDDDRLLVPVEDLNLVQKFSSAPGVAPQLDKLGTQTWARTKARVKKAVEEIAQELLELYARRKTVEGIAYSPGGQWEREFEKMFIYEETEDQLRAIEEVKRDMESPRPMDRLLCGDVGYGKTEVAMRAAFKAVMDGRQVAVLCPTTVLAVQHLNTFRQRMLLFPVRVEALTRLQSRKEQQKIIEDLKKGFVDIIIGTHRLLSPDVGFHNLGLLIIDEEQRFGVSHKERIKQLKASIDVLTLTATPIPRTLNLALSGLRDISLIETPPRDRLAVHTVVAPFNSGLVASAVKQELERQGQVYYIHNRIEDIDRVADLVRKLVPQARVITIHGRMKGPELEKRMLDFINQKYNVLVSTTIIENGIDIPLVNTLIVDRADLYGLAQLYQLRGRVGRSSRQAYAYFLVPPLFELSPEARERLKALKEFSELGSGFRLAARDLEIRGAGNILGHRQHGFIEAVGYEYFLQLLERAVREQKGEKLEEARCEINLKVDFRIPEDYLPQVNLRLNLYKRLSALENPDEALKIREEIQDRFGPLPPGVENLFLYAQIKYYAGRIKLKSLDRNGQRLLVKFPPEVHFRWEAVQGLLKRYRGNVSPLGLMTFNLPAGSDREFLVQARLILKELSGYTIIN
ncbi:MAG: Transcription-repair coupling factor [Candidatus Saccharicenans subterraneus]|uniref:Transcription-repair-coupling factor n=1 Tax=Candidatus Saccharicenans subterraneus TaxID=2508984 RepID=A0A3E2BN35_9BACT|nr:MAG: Transcription-repair coupling factor [Candidatus Saccharicenans subterraneum]